MLTTYIFKMHKAHKIVNRKNINYNCFIIQ